MSNKLIRVQSVHEKDILIRYENVKTYEDQFNLCKFQLKSIDDQQKNLLTDVKNIIHF